MTAAPILIAGALLISAGFHLGCWWATRKGTYDEGYFDCTQDADEAWEIVETVRPDVQRAVARRGLQ